MRYKLRSKKLVINNGGEKICSHSVALHKVIYVRFLRRQIVLVEEIAKMYPQNYIVVEEMLPLFTLFITSKEES